MDNPKVNKKELIVKWDLQSCNRTKSISFAIETLGR